MNKEKFYLNNRCLVLEELPNGFSKVIIQRDWSPSVVPEDFCMACIVGVGSHVCDKYGDVIDALSSDYKNTLCYVETEMLADEVVEVKHYNEVEKLVRIEQQKLKMQSDAFYKVRDEVFMLNREIAALKSEREKLSKALDAQVKNFAMAFSKKRNEEIDRINEDIYERKEALNEMLANINNKIAVAALGMVKRDE